MILAKVVGTVVATRKDPRLVSNKLLVVRPIDPRGKAEGSCLVAVDTVLVLAFADQLWFRDLPCPICILQRAGFIAAGFGIALNLIFGPRPSHYGLAILGAVVGGIMSADQVLHYIVPGLGSDGNAIFGLHLYSWALIMFVNSWARSTFDISVAPGLTSE